MSSWERSRHIPWSRAMQSYPQEDIKDLEHNKERVFWALQREAAEEENRERLRQAQQNADGGGADSGGGGSAAAAGASSIQGVQYSTTDLGKQILFGACIGTMTGAAFGFMDGMRSAGESEVLKKASNMAKGRFLLQGTTRSAATFGAFFGGFHAVKYGIRVLMDPGDYAEIGLAGTLSLGAMVVKPTTRASMPYATMLILMDAFNVYMHQGK